MFATRKSRWMVVAIVVALVAALLPLSSGAEAAGGVMAYGDVVTGQISNKSYFELWEFEGTKGDRIQITMIGDGQLDPYLGLIEAASEQVLAEDDDSAGNSNALIETTLPSSGTFIIVATRYDFDLGTSQGQYELELLGGGGPQPDEPVSSQGEEIQPGVYYMGEMALGTPAVGTIDDSSFAHVYSVQVEAGTELFIAMFADASNVDAYLIFADEEGNVLAEDDDTGAELGGAKTDALISLTVQKTGAYMIIATRSGLDQGNSSGAYMLIAGVPEEQQQQDPASNDMPEGVEYLGDLQVGSSANGTISDDIFVQLFTFNGTAGETVTITMKGTGGLDAYLGLIDPNDEVIAEDDDSAGGTDAQISIRLPESGVYIIVATRNGIDAGTSTGDYTLDLIAGPPPAPEGVSGAGGFGGLPGRGFVTEDTTFYLRGFGASKNPEKASPLEAFLSAEQALPGRSFEVGTESFFLSGFGKSTNPAKDSPIEAFFHSQQGSVLPGR